MCFIDSNCMRLHCEIDAENAQTIEVERNSTLHWFTAAKIVSPKPKNLSSKNHFQTTHKNAVNYMVYIKLSPLIFQVNGVVIEMDRELDGENLRVLFNVLVFRWPLHCNSLHTTTISMNGRKKNVVSNQLQKVCVCVCLSVSA